MMSDDLKPCPFCGNSKRSWLGVENWQQGFNATCWQCKARAAFKPTEAEAIAAWNRRASDEPDSAEQSGQL